MRNRAFRCKNQSMGEEGFEPSKAKPTDLQSVLVDHLSTRPSNSERSSLVARIALRNGCTNAAHARDVAQINAFVDAAADAWSLDRA